MVGARLFHTHRGFVTMSVFRRSCAASLLTLVLALSAGGTAFAAPADTRSSSALAVRIVTPDGQPYFCGFWKIKWC